MWPAYHFALFGALLYISYSLGMQFSNPDTEFDPAGPSAPSLPATISPVSDDILKCKITGEMCLVEACKEAGARCRPGWRRCIQVVQFRNGETRSMKWRFHHQTQSACQDCMCQKEKTAFSERPRKPRGRMKGPSSQRARRQRLAS
jgi:hypothetical protein